MLVLVSLCENLLRYLFMICVLPWTFDIRTSILKNVDISKQKYLKKYILDLDFQETHCGKCWIFTHCYWYTIVEVIFFYWSMIRWNDIQGRTLMDTFSDYCSNLSLCTEGYSIEL